jgi:hypothetical protein
VRSADEKRLLGRPDGEILKHATALHRVVVTHDLAFGRIEVRGRRGGTATSDDARSISYSALRRAPYEGRNRSRRPVNASTGSFGARRYLESPPRPTAGRASPKSEGLRNETTVIDLKGVTEAV